MISCDGSNPVQTIGRIRRMLPQHVAEQLTHALLTSWLDSCYSLLFGLPDVLINKLQRLQNTAARKVTGIKKFEHITPVLHQLHCLPVRQRMVFKILLLTYRALHGLAPAYLEELLELHSPVRTLRSSVDKWHFRGGSRNLGWGGLTLFATPIIYLQHLFSKFHYQLGSPWKGGGLTPPGSASAFGCPCDSKSEIRRPCLLCVCAKTLEQYPTVHQELWYTLHVQTATKSTVVLSNFLVQWTWVLFIYSMNWLFRLLVWISVTDMYESL